MNFEIENLSSYSQGYLQHLADECRVNLQNIKFAVDFNLELLELLNKNVITPEELVRIKKAPLILLSGVMVSRLTNHHIDLAVLFTNIFATDYHSTLLEYLLIKEEILQRALKQAIES